MRSYAQGISRLSIGVSTTLCKYILLPLLKNFIAENPNIKITISCQSTFETITALQKGSIDIGLVGIPADTTAIQSHTITYLPLKTIEDIFVTTDAYLTPLMHRYGGDYIQIKHFWRKLLSLCWIRKIFPASMQIPSIHASTRTTQYYRSK